MRAYGDIGGVHFERIGMSIYHLAFEYRLMGNHGTSTVYVNNMTELKQEIIKLNGGACNERQD